MPFSANDERIALVIETQAKLEGIRAARAENATYTRSVQQITAATQAQTATTQQAAATQAAAAQKVAAAQSRVVAGKQAEAAASTRTAAAAVAARKTEASAAVQAAVAAMEVRDGYEADIEALQRYGRTVDLTNKDAVAAFRESVQAQIEVGEAANVPLKQLERLDAVIKRLDRDAAKAQATPAVAPITPETEQSYERMNPRIKRAATSLALVSQAAINGQGSMVGLANAGGLAAESIAMMSKNAKVVSLASGFGAAVVVLTVMAGLYQKMGERSREIEQNDYQRMLHNAQTARSMRRVLDDLNEQFGKTIEDSDAISFIWRGLGLWMVAHGLPGFGKLVELLQKGFDLNEKIKDQEADEAKAAVERGRTLKQSFDQQTQQLALETQLADFRSKSADSLARQTALQKLQIDAQLVDTQREINQRYEIRDADGQIFALTTQQVRQRETLIQQARDQADTAKRQADNEAAITREELTRAALHRIAQGADGGGMDDRIAQIKEERDAAIAAGVDSVAAAAEAQQQIHALYVARLEADREVRHRAMEDDLEDQINAVNEERDRAIRDGGDAVLLSIEAENKVAKLRSDRMAQVIGLYDRMSKSAILHGTVVGKVASVAAKAIAIYEMIPKAKSDAQKGKSEFAAALADFAVPGKQAFGAAHLLASGAYFSSAAFGFAEAAGLGGGGGSSGGGGGGGGGSAPSSTFEPNSQNNGQGAQTIVLQTMDPYSGEAITHAIYEIGRAGKLSRPIYVPPTRGLAMAGAA